MPYHQILPRPVPRPVPLLMNAFSEALVAAFTVLGYRDMQKSGMPLEGSILAVTYGEGHIHPHLNLYGRRCTANYCENST
jgi:hypothetical protein